MNIWVCAKQNDTRSNEKSPKSPWWTFDKLPFLSILKYGYHCFKHLLDGNKKTFLIGFLLFSQIGSKTVSSQAGLYNVALRTAL